MLFFSTYRFVNLKSTESYYFLLHRKHYELESREHVLEALNPLCLAQNLAYNTYAINGWLKTSKHFVFTILKKCCSYCPRQNTFTKEMIMER